MFHRGIVESNYLHVSALVMSLKCKLTPHFLLCGNLKQASKLYLVLFKTGVAKCVTGRKEVAKRVGIDRETVYKNRKKWLPNSVQPTKYML